MKEVTTFNKESVYCDIPIIGSHSTFLKYVGSDDNSSHFKVIGGKKTYVTVINQDYGEVCRFFKNTIMYLLSKQEVKRLIRYGKISK